MCTLASPRASSRKRFASFASLASLASFASPARFASLVTPGRLGLFLMVCLVLAPPPSLRAQPLLHLLWTPQELAAVPGERQVRKRAQRIPPPLRLVPETTLPPLPDRLRGSIRRVRVDDPAIKPIALTFDLCQTAWRTTGYDGEVVDVLRRHNASATFFASGAWLADHAERAMQLMADPLFEIGNHGWTHQDPRGLSAEGWREEILKTQAQYELLRQELLARTLSAGLPAEAMAHVAPSIRALRFPFGFCNGAALAEAGRLGLPAIQWDLVTGDPDPHSSPARMAAVVLERARPGGIVIAHANGNNHGTAPMLREALPELEARGFRFVKISDLLEMGTPEATDACYGERPGDYDRPKKQRPPAPTVR